MAVIGVKSPKSITFNLPIITKLLTVYHVIAFTVQVLSSKTGKRIVLTDLQNDRPAKLLV